MDMNIKFFGITFFFYCFLLTSVQADDKSGEIKAKVICEQLLASGEYSYSELFSKKFITNIPEDYFKSLMNQVIESVQICSNFELINISQNKFRYKFISKKGRWAQISFSIDKKNKFNSFLVEDVFLSDIQFKNSSQIKEYLKTLPGNISLTLVNFNKDKLHIRGEERIPLASSFKLYVIGALNEFISSGHAEWETTYPITKEWKSLPSGIMHKWEDGKKVSLYEYAHLMIRISDNTATDHLLNIIGENKILEQLKIMENKYFFNNTPFLKTYEMFKLKWALPKEKIREYIDTGVSGKKDILENEIQKLDLKTVGTNGISMNTPSFIDEIEWFGSTNGICRGLRYLENLKDKRIFDILSKSVPFLKMDEKSHWGYAGFKGGSEPGVLVMNYLLKSKSGEFGCLSLSWNNKKNNLNTWIYFDLIKKLLTFSEKLI